MAVEATGTSSTGTSSIGASTFYVQSSASTFTPARASKGYNTDSVTISDLGSKLKTLSEKIQRFRDLAAQSITTSAESVNSDSTTDPASPSDAAPGSSQKAQLSGQADALLQNLKDIVKSFNDIAKFVQGNNSPGSGLSFTGKDDQLLTDLSAAVDGSKSADGSFSLNAILQETEGADTTVRDVSFLNAFVQNPQAVADALTKFAASVGGTNGIVRQYAGPGGLLAQGYTEIAAKRTQIDDAKNKIQEQRQAPLTSSDLKVLQVLAKQLSVTGTTTSSTDTSK